jgi:hypothetical protein
MQLINPSILTARTWLLSHGGARNITSGLGTIFGTGYSTISGGFRKLSDYSGMITDVDVSGSFWEHADIGRSFSKDLLGISLV